MQLGKTDSGTEHSHRRGSEQGMTPKENWARKRREEERKLDASRSATSLGGQIAYAMQPCQLTKDQCAKLERGGAEEVLEGNIDSYHATWLTGATPRTAGARQPATNKLAAAVPTGHSYVIHHGSLHTLPRGVC
jgi:hypothetical protein